MWIDCLKVKVIKFGREAVGSFSVYIHFPESNETKKTDFLNCLKVLPPFESFLFESPLPYESFLFISVFYTAVNTQQAVVL